MQQQRSDGTDELRGCNLTKGAGFWSRDLNKMSNGCTACKTKQLFLMVLRGSTGSDQFIFLLVVFVMVLPCSYC